MQHKLWARILLFVAIGGIGFVIDGGVLSFLVNLRHLNPYFSRLISFPIAVSVTWYLNRRWTFSSGVYNKKAPEYARYLGVQIIGAIINLTAYGLLLMAFAAFASIPILPLALGALVAMLFNFVGLHFFVFHSRFS
ncbi:MAG: GtrA family protein [Paludibacter sp.]|nr:GtrA family protein [Paludibacter sp.]